MKSNIGFKILYIVTALVVLFNTVFTVKSNFYFDIENLPKGQFVESQVSPDNAYTVNIYSVKNSVGSAIRAEVVKTAKGGKKSRNIFWQTDLKEADVSWQSNETVVISGVFLNLSDGATYDCRRGISLFQEGALEGEAAENIANG